MEARVQNSVVPARRVRRITIRAVAEAAGVSIGTVSNVLNDRHDRVSPETRRQVLRVAQELGYRPSRLARSLVTRRSATLALIVSEMTNPLYPPAIEGVERVASAAGWRVILSSAWNAEAQAEAAQVLLDHQVDGLIVFATSLYDDDRYLRQLAADGVPVITINRQVDDPHVTQVRFDHRGGAELAVQHLIDLGHTHIAHLAGPRSRLTAAQRLAGYQSVLNRSGLDWRDEYVQVADYTFDGGLSATKHLLSVRPLPTAIFAASEMSALGAYRALTEAGVRVPQDVSLVAFGNPPFLNCYTPAFTTVDLPVVEAGEQAARLLLARISAPEDPIAPPLVLPSRLVKGASTAPPDRDSGSGITVPSIAR